jgi:hypothetical protein
LVITMLGKGCYGRIHNPVALIVGFFYSAHMQLPWPVPFQGAGR